MAKQRKSYSKFVKNVESDPKTIEKGLSIIDSPGRVWRFGPDMPRKEKTQSP